nr:MAG: capsid protein [Cressdnaviricota sp.]
MPFTRKNRKFKPRYRRKFHAKRRTFKRSAANKPHLFKRNASVSVQITDGFINYVPIFKLSNLPSYTEFTTLYDQYRICAVKMKILYDATVTSTPVGNATAMMPNCISVYDSNDSSALTGIHDYEQYTSMKIRRLGDRPISLYIKPKTAMPVYQGVVLSGYAQGVAKWIDSNSPDVEYYGVKIGFAGNLEGGVGTNNIGHAFIECTYYIECRDVN